MEWFLGILIGILQITLLDLVLSGDNVGVIALATKNLSPEYAKKASVVGIFGAVALRILFACIITYVMMIQWLPIKLLGGLLLIKITWDLIKPEEEVEHGEVKSQDKFMKAVLSIIIADLSMSIDNVLAIGASAHGNVLLIIFGIMLNIPILFFGSRLVANLMRKYKIVIYIGAAILAHTAFGMILEDRLLDAYVNGIAETMIPLMAGILTLLYGFIIIKKTKEKF
ncbi:TerC family protein [Clostridium sp. 19966]|uniref:TerC family protein n=1 Tax=Clostridium sp. 19966 TaxID=2768166 RepID=UPI0028DF72BB|nr:TerC family protein [Clostridium sp. 19966]MDT8715720.1 TerC family protein [Clostridium sp. 19966]